MTRNHLYPPVFPVSVHLFFTTSVEDFPWFLFFVCVCVCGLKNADNTRATTTTKTTTTATTATRRQAIYTIANWQTVTTAL